jgi:hypothetical protein
VTRIPLPVGPLAIVDERRLPRALASSDNREKTSTDENSGGVAREPQRSLVKGLDLKPE